MRGAERIWFGPRLEHSPVLPHRVRCIERVIFSFGTFEKVRRFKEGEPI
jgi:hypothetical protein